MPEPRTFHFFMPDRRSLCDRRSKPTENRESSTKETPMCGSCMVILYAIRVKLALFARESTSVWPETARESVHALDGSRWESMISELPGDVDQLIDLRHAAAMEFSNEAIDALVRQRQVTRANP